MSNIILGDHMRKMKVTNYEVFVGGFPKSRKAPLAYKTDFPVLEVFEELSGPGRSVEDGKVVERLALAETMTIDLPTLGTMACLNVDGPEPCSIPVPASPGWYLTALIQNQG